MHMANRVMGEIRRGVRLGSRAALASVLLMSAGMALPAHADAVLADSVLEEIIVTAEKRAEPLQNVGVSVTAISTQTLHDFSIQNFQNYATLVPGLTTSFTTATRGITPVGLRGVSTLNGTFISGQNTVGFYLGDSPIPVMNPHLTDLQRIEVLRGPQGTLYGSSSLGGTIKLVPNAPLYNEWSGSAKGDLSSTERGGLNSTIEGMVNVPLASNAALRLSVYRDSQSGYLDFLEINPNVNATLTANGAGTLSGVTKKDINDDETSGGRAALAVTPIEGLKVTASVMYNHERQSALSQYTPAFGLTQRSYFFEPATDTFTFADLAIEWDLHWAQLVSTTSHFDSKNHTLTDQTEPFSYFLWLSGEGLPKLPAPTYQNNKEWTHETRLLSSWSGPLQAIGGVFYTTKENPFGFSASAQGRPQFLGVPTPDDTLFSNASTRKRQELAVFGEATWSVTHWLNLIVGLRWYDFKYSNADVFVGSPLLVDTGRLVRNSAANAHGVNPRFRIEVRPAENQLLYASAGKGFRMGGPNYPLPHTSACLASLHAFFGPAATDVPSDFKSDSLWSYEAGVKSAWLGNRLTLNASAYHIDWRNTQVPIVLGGLCPFSGESTNAGTVRSNGFELEAAVAPFTGMSASIGVSHIHERVAQALTFPGATVVLAPEGGELPNTPEWQASLLAQYKFPLGARTNGFVRGDYRYESSRLAGLTYAARKDKFNIVNLRAGINREGWEAAVFADNLGDARPSYLGVPAINTVGTYGLDETQRPRTIGLTVSKQF
jgi:outer membrane receptor protein involved in Fe transport